MPPSLSFAVIWSGRPPEPSVPNKSLIASVTVRRRFQLIDKRRLQRLRRHAETFRELGEVIAFGVRLSKNRRCQPVAVCPRFAQRVRDLLAQLPARSESPRAPAPAELLRKFGLALTMPAMICAISVL
jgi:hypothetical protein